MNQKKNQNNKTKNRNATIINEKIFFLKNKQTNQSITTTRNCFKKKLKSIIFHSDVNYENNKKKRN
jgi:hypothetical protein